MPFVSFRPAQVMGVKEVYVSFYVLDPSNNKLKRLRVRCNKLKKRREKLRHATLLCAEINRKLYVGWNPLTGSEPQEFKRKSIKEATNDYYETKRENLRKDSKRSYSSMLSFFIKWCEKQKISNWQCNQFSCQHAGRFLSDYNSSVRSSYSYNSMLCFLKGLFKYFYTSELIQSNPFESFQPKKRETKQRTIIPKAERKRIANYFQKRKMPEYIAMMKLCFKCFVRPKEILMLKICDIDYGESLIRIPPDVSKNHIERTIGVPADIMRFFRNLNHDNPNDYIFSQNYRPGPILYTTKNLFKTWQTMREKLCMPPSYHFYSLKDTGITEMLEKGVPTKYVMELAGHHSFSMTERYVHKSEAKKILSANKLMF